MKRFVLLAALFVAAAIFLLWLAPVAPSVPLAARVLSRTNHPNGQRLYLVGVTNLSGGNLEIVGEGELFPGTVSTATGPRTMPQLFRWDLAPHAGMVVALAPPVPGSLHTISRFPPERFVTPTR